jgi:hypothetical protein
MNFTRFFRRPVTYSQPADAVKLNVGCGAMHLPGWVNIDINPKVNPDICCDLLTVKNHFQPASVDEIMLLHSISYLSLWEARIFFKNALTMLKDGAALIMEFPDIAKCARALLKNDGAADEYLEAVRGIYAFDMNQIKRKQRYVPYAFGWSAWHISVELKAAGFRLINIEEPQTHGPRSWRDVRIVAFK